MAYKILYVEDQKAESREHDLKDLGFVVESYDPSSDLSEILAKLNDINALILDYRLTKGENHACFDAPTIAATLRSIHTEDFKERPIILMSNEDLIVDYYKDYTNQDLFDFAISKKDFLLNKDKFKKYLISFVEAYSKIKADNFDLVKIFQIKTEERCLIHPQIQSKLNSKEGYIYEHSRLINDSIIHAVGALIGEDILAARLGVSKDSKDWNTLLESLKESKYTGIFSEIHSRWWMDKVLFWWGEIIKSETPLRRLNAEERVNIIKTKLSLTNLEPAVKTNHSSSSNFWTICKFSSQPLDPFDGIELLKKDYLPWQEKEYISFDSALTEIESYKNSISEIDKKAIRELSKTVNANG